MELLETYPGPLVVPSLVVAEVAHRVGSRGGPRHEIWFLADLTRGTLTVEPLHAANWLRIAELVARYADLPLGTVDGGRADDRLGGGQVA